VGLRAHLLRRLHQLAAESGSRRRQGHPGTRPPRAPSSGLARDRGRSPRALSNSTYELLERALRDRGDRHPNELHELAARAPETDPDDFAANFKRLGLLANEHHGAGAVDAE